VSPQPGDVAIRDVTGRSGEYLIADALTGALLRGSFDSLAGAAVAAYALAGRARVWREHSDDRGRSLGPPFPLHL
jgi:hypothetical protein